MTDELAPPGTIIVVANDVVANDVVANDVVANGVVANDVVANAVVANAVVANAVAVGACRPRSPLDGPVLLPAHWPIVRRLRFTKI